MLALPGVLAASFLSLSVPQGNVWTVDDGPNSFGRAWLCDLNADGSLDSLSNLPLPEAVSDFDGFASSAVGLGDLNGDGTQDLAVGAPGEDRAGVGRGCVWLLYRAPDGSLSARVPLRPGRNFQGARLPDGAGFGSALTNLGDVDGDGTLELAVGATLPEPTRGFVWVLSIDSEGHVSRERVIGRNLEGFIGTLDDGDAFGASLTNLGDLDGNGVTDFAVGATGDDDGASSAGAVWILRLRSDGRVLSHQKISATQGGFAGPLHVSDRFGASLATLGDVDGNGVADLAVGAIGDDDGGTDSGAVWIVLLNPDGTVLGEQKISKTEGGLGNHADTGFGADVAPIGDRNSDGVPDVAVGASSSGTGAVWILFLNTDGTVQSSRRLATEFTGVANGDLLGACLASLGDWDGDGRPDLLVGAPLRDGEPTAPDFTTISDAINAAAAGDTILIHGGFYSTGIQLTARSLNFVARDPLNAKVRLIGITDLTAGQRVSVSGVVSLGSTVGDHCAGRLWFEDCLFQPASAFLPTPGILLNDCQTVVMNRCNAKGLSSFYSDEDTPAPPGAQLGGGTTLHAYDCRFTGADPLCFMVFDYRYLRQPGGNGISSESGEDVVYLSRCTLVGTDSLPCTWASQGGKGFLAAGVARVLDTTASGGTGNPNGADYFGNIQFLSGEGLSMFVNNPTRASEATLFTLDGPPGALAWVFFSLQTDVRYRPLHQGTDLLGSGRFLSIVGVLDAQGRLESVQHLGELPPGYDILRLYAQAQYVLPAAANFPLKASAVPRRVQLGAGAVVQRLSLGF